ncbi:NACHT and ankyrin domain protein [Colletotrichum tofieldiae]|nr:NACHT and ankyrin domain protein [Colletotrichum tofieldiae]
MALKKELDRLPRDLTETYDRMLQKIPREYWSSSVRLLQFVVHSKKPLTLEVAVEVVATDIDDDPPHFHCDGRVFSNADILRHCPSLVSVIELEDWDGVIRKELHLAHFSVKEYLLLQDDFDPMKSSITITKTCLAYLTDIEGSRWRLAEEYPMAQYAAESWLDLVKAGRAEPPDDVTTAIASFLQEKNTLKRWTYFNEEIDGRWYRKLDNDEPIGGSLYYACRSGLTAVAKMIINQGADVNSHRGVYGTALQAASHFGHLETVRLLVDNQADVNAEGGEHGTALQAASSEGHFEIVRLLLDKRADANAQPGAFATALQAASYNQHMDIVRLLVYEQADVNAEGGKHGTALQAVLRDGPFEYLWLRHQNPDDWNASAVRTASYDRYLEILRILLDKQADVNAPGANGTALGLAMRHGDLNIVKILLEYGADINRQGEQFAAPLEAAFAAGHEGLALMLLERGADLNLQCGTHGSLLSAASSGGSEKIVEILIDKDVDVNIQVGTWGTALHNASLRGHEKIVQMLIDKNADANVQGGVWGNALQAASYGGYEKIVEILVNSGAQVDFQAGGEYGTALRAACRGRKGKIVKKLLDFGADISILISHYSCFGGGDELPEHAGFSTFWKVLTELGADSEVERGRLSGLLRHACASNCTEAIEKLISLGADVNGHSGGLAIKMLFIFWSDWVQI